MKGRPLQIGTIALIALLFGALYQVGAGAQDSWTYGGVQYKLPVPRGEVKFPEQVPETHTVAAGDTLWGISGTYLQNNFYWPLIWELNMDKVPNPHRIYPGQVLKLPGAAMAAGKEGMTPPTDADKAAAKLSEVAPAEIVKSCGYISEEKVKGFEIIGADRDMIDMAHGDVFYFRGGTADGVKPGEKFFIVRNSRQVKHPITHKYLGYLVNIVGEATSLCVQEQTASGSIDTANTAVTPGDMLIPYSQIEVPMRAANPNRDRCAPPTEKAPGYIVECYRFSSKEVVDSAMMATGDVAYFDVGSAQNVVPGDYMTIYRARKIEGFEKEEIGQACVMRTQEKFCSAIITNALQVIQVGDLVELRK